ncbi:MAG: hypothetical protein ACOH1J_04625 [Microbacteriaceae bacterium]
MVAKKSTPDSEAQAANETGPIIATVEDDDSSTKTVAVVAPVEIVVDEPEDTSATPQVVYVTVPAPPQKKGNRGAGVLLAFAGTVVYAITLAIVLAIMSVVATGRLNVGFIANLTFLIPVALFAVGLIIVVLVVNRAGWWSYVIGSVVVALVVYFGTVAVILLFNGLVTRTADEARELFSLGLVQPFSIASALVAREVAIWTGVVIGMRGKKVKTRNAAAREAYAREEAERRAEATVG